MNTPTQAELKAGLAIVLAVTEAIRELGEAPAGPIYAALMHKTGMDYQTFQKVVSILTGSGLVVKRGDLLVWIGPRLSEVVS
jgi:DNA-binding IclR family transcriptional regulator